jgi:hypothetical protein
LKEAKQLTTGSKLKKAHATAESLAAEMKIFAMDTEDPAAKEMYANLASTMEFAAGQIKTRLDKVGSNPTRPNH